MADSRFDLVVVGGGIYGTTIAWDASQRGLSVALVDRQDFGAGTSFNSAKTVHGGVRALQSGDLAQLRQFLGERRALSRIAPHLIDPLPFVIPTYGRITRHRWLMRGFFAAYDLLARRRNEGVDLARQLPDSRLLSRDECLRLNPAIDPAGVTGGIEWHDCQMYNSDRLTLAFLLSAHAAGAVAANYTDVTALLVRDGRVGGVSAHDRLGNQDFDIRADVVVNCGGPWAPSLVRTLAPNLSRSMLPTPLSKSMNVVTNTQLGTTHACGSWADGRLLFAAPWRDSFIVGTSHHPYDGAPADRPIRREELDEFITQINRAFPRASLAVSDIRLVHCGLLPATQAAGRHEALRKTSLVTDHRADGIHGLVSVLGVRYTTARETAQRAVDLVFTVREQTPPPCRTADTPLAGGDIPDVARFLGDAERSPDAAVGPADRRRLARSYGTRYTAVLDHLRAAPSDAAPLGATCPVTRGEVRHAVRQEMAVTLADAVLRRTEAGSAGHPGPDALAAAADVMADDLGWTPEQVASEVASVDDAYAIPD